MDGKDANKLVSETTDPRRSRLHDTMSPELQFLLDEINMLFDEQNAKWDARFSGRDEKREASAGAEHAAASTLTSVDMPGTFHTSGAAVAAATTSFAAPGVPIVELPTTCSTPGLNGGAYILTPAPTAPTTTPMPTSTQTASPTLPVVVMLSAMGCVGVDQGVAATSSCCCTGAPSEPALSTYATYNVDTTSSASALLPTTVTEETITYSSSAAAAPLAMDATLNDVVIDEPTKCSTECEMMKQQIPTCARGDLRPTPWPSFRFCSVAGWIVFSGGHVHSVDDSVVNQTMLECIVVQQKFVVFSTQQQVPSGRDMQLILPGGPSMIETILLLSLLLNPWPFSYSVPGALLLM
ncbi:hypothetical protein BS78_01G471900 [Paspalum vaginatum]|nr:hypothetical protein BS78_01G471900 [Paspalum vaginatum]